MIKNLPTMQEMQETGFQSLDREGPVKKEMATHSSILAREILWAEEPGRLQSVGFQESDMTDHADMHAGACINE